MKNSKLRRALTLAACAVMLVCLSVGATLAYLTDDESVTNTFTVGKVEIVLDENDVDESKTNTTTEGRDRANAYHLYPGHEYVKDPIVHIDSESDNCWIFVKVENGIEAIEDSANTIAAQMAALGWSVVDGETNVYAYKEIVGAGMNIPVFQSFKIAGTVENTTLAQYEDAEIVVTAYAVQADGFGSAQAAWDATFGAPTT